MRSFQAFHFLDFLNSIDKFSEVCTLRGWREDVAFIHLFRFRESLWRHEQTIVHLTSGFLENSALGFKENTAARVIN